MKRTVEGDLGLRVSATAAVESLGAARLAADLGWEDVEVRGEAERRTEATELVSDDDRFDTLLATAAIAEALRRHAGRLEPIPLRKGQWVQTGKDLRAAPTIVGSGGVFTARADAEDILRQAVAEAGASDRLVPQNPEVRIDRDYVLFAVGLLCPAYPEAAAALARASLSIAGPVGSGPVGSGPVR